MRHGHDKRVHRTSVFQIANEADFQVLERALRFQDGVKIEQRLRRMLIGSVAGVDDGHG